MRSIRLHKNKGFTLAEVVTTVAIIGGLSAIAVPNYMRIKMDTNMEMVRQHVKVIGEALTEYHAKYGRFPSESSWGTGAETAEEVSITASLSAIDDMGFTPDGYATFSNQALYIFRTEPKPAQFGIKGDRCLVLDTLRPQGEWINCASAYGQSLALMGGLTAQTMRTYGGRRLSFSDFLMQSIGDNGEIPAWVQQLFNNSLESYAYLIQRFKNDVSCSLSCGRDTKNTTTPAIAVGFDNVTLPDGIAMSDVYQRLFENARAALMQKGIKISQTDVTDQIKSDYQSLCVFWAPCMMGVSAVFSENKDAQDAGFYAVGLELESELGFMELLNRQKQVGPTFTDWANANKICSAQILEQEGFCT